MGILLLVAALVGVSLFAFGATATAVETQAICTPGPIPDFNGDGIRDIAIADPEATVEGFAKAGLVRVVLGGGKGLFEISQSLPGMTANPEAGDKFGYSIATYDADEDGCMDLAVGAPYEDVTKDGNGLADAGAVYVIHGSPTGFGAGSVIDTYTQAGLDSSTTTEAGDLFGYALAAGRTFNGGDGQPYLAVGVPGEDIGTISDAGCIHYVQGTTKTTANQDDPGVPGSSEANDRFGASLAGTPKFLAVGNPGEAIGTQAFAGSVTMFNHTISGGYPTALTAVDENQQELVSGTAEKGDRFGTSVALAPYREAGAGAASDALLVVGTPNEDVGDVQDAGAVTVVKVAPTGALTEVNLIDRLSSNVEGDPAVSEFFGQRVAVQNLDSSVTSTPSDIKLAVGVPNQDVGAAENTGAVQLFPGLGAPGTGDRILTQGDGLLPGVSEAREFTGMGLWMTTESLYVGVPYNHPDGVARGAMYKIPWTVFDAGTGSVTVYKPGENGIPEEDTAFGSAIR